MRRVSTSEEGRLAGLGASSFNRAVWAGAGEGYEPCFVRMEQGYGVFVVPVRRWLSGLFLKPDGLSFGKFIRRQK